MKFCLEYSRGAKAAAFLPLFFFLAIGAVAQTAPQPAQTPSTDATSPADDQPNKDRILGLMPNYLTVEDPDKKVPPLTAKQKYLLFAKETFDPFTVVAAAAGAALSQSDNDDPKYGQGSGPYAQRFGAAVADITTQNFFQDAVLASILHEDPRYFRRGAEFGVWYRVGYALSRVVVTRTDAGNPSFNYSGVLGMGMGIALSNAYYPNRSVNAGEVGYRFGTSVIATALANLLPEFWPDIHQKLFRKKPHTP